MLKLFKHDKIRGTISTSVPHSKFCGTRPPYSRDLRPCVEEYAIITSLGKLAKQELKTREEKALEDRECPGRLKMHDQAERTIVIRKRKFLNKFSIIHNALCRVFVAIAAD